MSSVKFLSWRLGKFLQKHNLRYSYRRHFKSFYFEAHMPSGEVRLIRVADHAPNMNHPWQPDYCIGNDKDYRKFKKETKRSILKEYGYA